MDCIKKLLAALGCTLVFAGMAVPGDCQTMTRKNGYINTVMTNGVITLLQFDGSGSSNYGMNTVAVGGGIRGCASMSLGTRTLTITPVSGQKLEWDTPFYKPGYYDADAHLNYPNNMDTLGATPLVLPFKCFVSSSGNTLRIEYFKRLSSDPNYFTARMPMNVQDGGKLLMQSDATQNWDLNTTWPGCTTLDYEPLEDRLTFKHSVASGSLVITVNARGAADVPSSAFLVPKAAFVPDAQITYEPTGKTLGISQLMTELMRFGAHWHAYPRNFFSEFIVEADSYMLDDPRSFYMTQLRSTLLNEQKYVGYDRFGHFGHAFNWGRYPDYGSPQQPNLATTKAPHDMRFIQMNALELIAAVRYVLATGDTSFLYNRRTRYVATDGAETQPICGSGCDTYDTVLSAGDIRPDPPASFPNMHFLGQEFTTTRPFTQAKVQLVNVEWRTSPGYDTTARGKVKLYDHYNGTLIAQTSFTIPKSTWLLVAVTAPSQLPAGKYYVEVTDDISGVEYFGPGVGWWTKTEGNYVGGDAYTGPMHGDTRAYIQTLFDYLRNYMWGATDNLICFKNDPNYNRTDDKSGIDLMSLPSAYFDAPGGAYDAYIALWYPEACTWMAKLSDYLEDTASADSYRSMRALADTAYNNKFWHSVTENGKTFFRYSACIDWNNATHDNGHAYYNLEAASRGIPGPGKTKNILWWLDRGQYSPDGIAWHDYIYSVWGVAVPFNTISTMNWRQYYWTIDYLGLLNNGGTRLDFAARDIQSRVKYLSADNMHERNTRILARFASPDRLTGGRTGVNSPTDRWHFLTPDSDRADIEGFREIFAENALLATYQPITYLQMNYIGTGLELKPRVPSEFTSMQFDNIGYWGAMWSFKSEAQRTASINITDAPTIYTLPIGPEIGQTFSASAPFNKIGLRVSVSPFKSKQNNQLTIKLYRPGQGGTWIMAAENWYSHVQDGQWIWATSDSYLPTNAYYFITITSVRPAAGESIRLYYNTNDIMPGGCRTYNGLAQPGDYALQVMNEKMVVTAETVYNPNKTGYSLVGARGGTITTDLGSGLVRLSAVMESDETLLLKPSGATRAKSR